MKFEEYVESEPARGDVHLEQEDLVRVAYMAYLAALRSGNHRLQRVTFLIYCLAHGDDAHAIWSATKAAPWPGRHAARAELERLWLSL